MFRGGKRGSSDGPTSHVISGYPSGTRGRFQKHRQSCPAAPLGVCIGMMSGVLEYLVLVPTTFEH